MDSNSSLCVFFSLIPLKQGYVYRKFASGIYKRKYVTLCSDNLMTYYPSFQAYIDNVDSK